MSSTWVRLLALAVVLGGILWIPYGVFEMLQPWGTDTVYRDEPGYEQVTHVGLYWVYSLPGGLALLLTSLGLLGVLARLQLSASRIGRVGLILACVAVVLAVLSIVGVVVLFDPLFTAPRILGTLALGTAAFLAGIAARRTGRAPGWGIGLLLLGLVGVFLFPLWPLVYAVQWLSEGAGAAVIGVFGLGWALVGYALLSATRDGAGYVRPVTG
ncbi:MAG: hypothetical protein M3Q29_19945 [Chloroflexota bacterium]|nr:hypothetical protein [Chloroflexota bacterium]